MFNKLALAILISLCATAAQATPNLKDGLWEITSRLDTPGMPTNLPPVKHNQCLSSKDAVPQKPEKEQDCKVANLKQNGDGISWAIRCNSSEGALDSSGKATYRGVSMDGMMTMTVRDKSGKDVMKMNYQITGKRIGDCPQ